MTRCQPRKASRMLNCAIGPRPPWKRHRPLSPQAWRLPETSQGRCSRCRASKTTLRAQRPWPLSPRRRPLRETLPAGALQTAQGIGGSSRASALAAVTTAQAAVGDFAAALQTAQNISDDSSRASVLAAVITAQAAAGGLASALQSARGMRSEFYRAEVLTAVAAAQAAAGDLAGALEMLQFVDDDGLSTVPNPYADAAQAWVGWAHQMAKAQSAD